MNQMQSFEELDSWKKAREIRQIISKEICKSLPAEEKYRLRDQLIRSSRSVTANIAEGYGRYYFKESSRFLIIARGSLFETLEHITVCYDEGYISKDMFSTLRKRIFESLRILNGYIRYLKKQSLK